MNEKSKVPPVRKMTFTESLMDRLAESAQAKGEASESPKVSEEPLAPIPPPAFEPPDLTKVFEDLKKEVFMDEKKPKQKVARGHSVRAQKRAAKLAETRAKVEYLKREATGPHEEALAKVLEGLLELCEAAEPRVVQQVAAKAPTHKWAWKGIFPVRVKV